MFIDTTRFAPSPSGHLHLGHAFSALKCAHSGMSFVLRIEDIDQGRCRPEFITSIYEDLAWLGFHWESPVRIQSQHMKDYAGALHKLQRQGLLYPCFCTRKNIQIEIQHASHAPHGPDGALYPGTCRKLSLGKRNELMAQEKPFALRLDMQKACATAGPLTWHDRLKGIQDATPEIFGDVVLARKDIPTSYHLSVSLDDHLQGITLITRGEDLFQASHIHRLLQSLLDLDTPDYAHHKLLCDENGKRYAKRDKSLTLRSLREQGISAAEILERFV